MKNQLLESCRNTHGQERRHLRVMGTEQPLCGVKDEQSGAGAGRFSNLLAWPTCQKCHKLALAMGPHEKQRDDAPLSLGLQQRRLL